MAAEQYTQSIDLREWVEQIDGENNEAQLTLRAPLVQSQQMVASEDPFHFVNCTVEVPQRYIQHHLVYDITARSVVIEEDEQYDLVSREEDTMKPVSISVLVGNWMLRNIRNGSEQFTRADPLPAFALQMRRNHSSVNIKMRFPMCAQWYKRLVVVELTTLYVPNELASRVSDEHLYLQSINPDPCIPALHFFRGTCYVEEERNRRPRDVLNELIGYQQPPPRRSRRGGRGGRATQAHQHHPPPQQQQQPPQQRGQRYVHPAPTGARWGDLM